MSKERKIKNGFLRTIKRQEEIACEKEVSEKEKKYSQKKV